MPKVIISADSTVDLNTELQEQYQIHYYPFHIMYRGKDCIDNITITNEDIFAGFAEDGELPQTGASSPYEFIEHFRRFTDEGCEVVHISLASSLSSAHANACIAAEQLSGVYVIDSQNLSSASGLLVLHAARMAKKGMDGATIADELEKLRLHCHASFVLDTLKFLAAGGRCPSLLANVSTLLNIKPEIVVSNADGSMHVGKLYRGSRRKIAQRYIRDTLTKYPDIKTDDIFICTSEIDDEFSDLLCSLVEERLHPQRIHRTISSVTISSHCGPKCYGILFMTESPSN